MIGFSFIEENKDGFFFRKNIEVSNYLPKNYMQDTLDLDMYSIKDFLDHLSVQRVTDYIFVSNGERIKRLVVYLNQLSDVSFHLCSEDGAFLYGNHQVVSLFWIVAQTFTVADLGVEAQMSEYEGRRRRGIHQFLTGIYPGTLPKHLVKHVWIEQLDLVKKLDQTIFLNFALNSVIYFEKADIESECIAQVPIMVLPFAIITEEPVYKKICEYPKQELLLDYDEFCNSASIRNNYDGEGISDFSTAFDLDSNNRLFIAVDGIYADKRKSRLLTNQLESNFFHLKNASSMQKTSKIDKETAVIFHLCFTLKNQLIRSEKAIFLLLNNETASGDRTYLGIQNAGSCYVYTVEKNKIVQVSETIFKLLEEYKNGKVSSMEAAKVEQLLQKIG